MIKIEGKYSVNFVDDWDVFVGYELSAHCCEVTGYYISPDLNEDELEDYRFDTEKEPKVTIPTGYGSNDKEYSSVEIELYCAHDPKRRATLTLHNSHNGYYSHGWTMGALITAKGGSI